MKTLFKILISIIVTVAVSWGVRSILSSDLLGSGGLFPSGSKNTHISDSKTEDFTEIENLTDLRDYIIEQRDEDVLEFSFYYSGDDSFKPIVLAEIYGASYVSWIQEGDIYHVTMTEFPGDRIVAAYQSGDDSELSPDEKRALEKAEEMVEEAKAQSSTPWELELRLYEMLCQHITYSDKDVSYFDPEDMPRHVSVIGALLDGEANCQGYTDAFYTLGSIAGFEIGRLAVETPDIGHMVNTICFDRQWYVVDVTYGDSDDGPVNYRLLNAGMDMIGEYWWDEELEPYSIAEVTDSKKFYYYLNDIVYDDMDKMAYAVARQWSDTGDEVILAMLRDEPDGEQFSDILYDALSEMGKSFSYQVFYSSNETDSFYAVVFSN